MSDPKIGPLPPPDWDLPDPTSDPNSPDSSFNDDHVAARVKMDEAAKARAVNDRFVQEAPKRVNTQYEKIEEATAFKPASDDELARRSRLRDEILRRGGRRRSDTLRRRDSERSGADPHVDDVEERVELLLADMEAIMGELDDLEQDAPRGPQSPDDPRSNELQTRLSKLELQAKLQLQLLLAGGIGLSLLGDPRVTFKRLFDRIDKWPKKVRPGKRPVTDEDFDNFLSWIFEPPGAPDDAEPAW